MIKDFAKKLLDRALEKGFADAEVHLSDGNSFSVSILEGEIDKYQNSASRGISFRGTYNGKMGYSYSEWIDDEAIDIIVTEAMQNSEILEEPEQTKLFTGFADEKYAEVCSFSEDLQNISIEDRISAAFLMEKTAKAGELIKAVDHCGVSYGEGSTLLMNTYGLELEHRSNSAGGNASARAVKEGGDDGKSETKVGGEWWRGKNWSEFDPAQIGREAAENAAAKLGAKQVASGRYKIVMQNTTFASLVSAYTTVISADTAQKGLSLLSGKLGEKIASVHFTLLDAPLYPDRESPFDSEGVATYDKAVIENGVFKTFLHNLKTAAKDGVKSTGNASGGYRSPIRVSPRNLYVKPGEISHDELIKKAGDGLYITSLGGLHSGTNSVSGDFSVLAEGFVIENGELTRPVEQITVAGNFFEVIKDVEAVADEDDFRWGGIGSPAVLLGGLSVAGE
jgi:PmbA protein